MGANAKHRIKDPGQIAKTWTALASRHAPVQPAFVFEKETGISGIAGMYKFPQGMTASEFDRAYCWTIVSRPSALENRGLPESKITHLDRDIDTFISQRSPAYVKFLSDVWQELVQMNPPLEKVILDKTSRSYPNQLYHALSGAASLFNADDINFYLCMKQVKGRSPGADSRKIPAIEEDINWIEEKTGRHMFWVPSPASLQKIRTKLLERDAVKTSRQTRPKPRNP